MKNYHKHYNLNLRNKKVIITGGGGFLAFYIAKAFLVNKSKVIIIDYDEKKLDKNFKRLNKYGDLKKYHCNLLNEKEISDLFYEKKIVPDILINNASFTLNSNFHNTKFFKDFLDYDINILSKTVSETLNLSFLITKKTIGLMKKNKKGNVINISSDIAIISPDHRIYEEDLSRGYKGVNFNTPLGYPVAKSGILAFTRYLATRYAKDGIRVNAICPAGVENNHDTDFKKKLSSLIPLGRMMKPEEFPGPILFLASDLSSFITGTHIMVDGGRSII